jgi:NhaA family Na+:H+ antiporter
LGEFADELRESLGAFQSTTTSANTTMNEDRKAAIRRVNHAVGLVTMPLESLEHLLAPWVIFGIVPLFALANAGVDLRGISFFSPSRIAVGVVAGLMFGKPIGIIGGAIFARRVIGLQLPADISWRALGGVGLLGGIGFTMSLFIAQLAFGQSSTHDEAKAAILLASVMSGVMGYAVLAKVTRKTEVLQR